MHVIRIVTHVAAEAEGRALGQRLVDERVAACAHVGRPVRSVYRWRGEVETADEWELDVITTETRLGECVESIRSAHSYELPAIMWTVLECSGEYGAWVVAETSGDAMSEARSR
jgi:periplasmic divalent cation tolerance protein